MIVMRRFGGTRTVARGPNCPEWVPWDRCSGQRVCRVEVEPNAVCRKRKYLVSRLSCAGVLRPERSASSSARRALLFVPELLRIDIFDWHGHRSVEGNAFSGVSVVISHHCGQSEESSMVRRGRRRAGGRRLRASTRPSGGRARPFAKCRRRDSNPRHADYDSSEAV